MSLDCDANQVDNISNDFSMTISIQHAPGLPNDPLFRRLLHHAQNNHNVLIRDSTNSIEATAAQFLRDIVAYSERIRAQQASQETPENGGPYICILATLSYEFVVAFYATIALGAAAVPLSTNILPQEGAWLLDKCHATCLLVGSNQTKLASQIRMLQENTHTQACPQILIQHPIEESSSIMPMIHPDVTFPPSGPGLLLFTSGTTGPPKGVIIPRQFFFPHVTPDCNSSDVAIVYRPINGLAGVLNLMDLLFVGALAELFPDGFEPEPIWQRLSQGGITFLAGATRFWQILMSHYEECLSNLPAHELLRYEEGARNIRIAWFGGGMPSPAAKRFWLNMRGEKPWIVKYGASELGREVMQFSFTEHNTIFEPVIGKPLPGIEVKLTEGNHGELLIKSPTMMIGYIDDQDRTNDAFDENGYYRTGDLVHLNDHGTYVIDGRASADFVRFNGLRVPVYEVESHLCELTYVAEAHVLCIPDSRYGQRVGSLVRLRPSAPNSTSSKITLAKLRKDLSSTLAAYKLPTLLRIVGANEELPTSAQGKLARSQAMQMYFPELSSYSVMQWPREVEVWSLDSEVMVSTKPWDWGGVSA